MTLPEETRRRATPKPVTGTPTKVRCPLPRPLPRPGRLSVPCALEPSATPMALSLPTGRFGFTAGPSAVLRMPWASPFRRRLRQQQRPGAAALLGTAARAPAWWFTQRGRDRACPLRQLAVAQRQGVCPRSCAICTSHAHRQPQLLRPRRRPKGPSRRKRRTMQSRKTAQQRQAVTSWSCSPRSKSAAWTTRACATDWQPWARNSGRD
mmetsp:Transcript_8132/g.32043  ORF Transcript_8132/g.32043 Transcript_8132/m.32043 type:complete len:208 (+) Transcript_8132:1003-1626(+)